MGGVYGAGEQFLESDHPVAGVQEKGAENLVRAVAQFGRQEAARGVRAGQRLAAVQPGLELAPGKLERCVDLGVFRRPQAGLLAQRVAVGFQQPPQAAELGDQVARQVECRASAGADSKQDRQQFGVAERAGAVFQQPFPRPLA